MSDFPLLVDREPPELLVHDASHPCSYLPDRVARFPFRLPIRPLTPEELDGRLALGDRRHGRLLYRPSCGECSACEAIRLDVAAFTMSKSQRRVFRRGERELRLVIGPPTADPAAVRLYDLHRFGRALALPDSEPMTVNGYAQFLVDRSWDAYEMRFFYGRQIASIAIVDEGKDALSAVYCHHDPELARFSLGTYAILKQIEAAKRDGRRYLYLGLYIAGCKPMAYKEKYRPHERRIGGQWVRFD